MKRSSLYLSTRGEFSFSQLHMDIRLFFLPLFLAFLCSPPPLPLLSVFVYKQIALISTCIVVLIAYFPPRAPLLCYPTVCMKRFTLRPVHFTDLSSTKLLPTSVLTTLYQPPPMGPVFLLYQWRKTQKCGYFVMAHRLDPVLFDTSFSYSFSNGFLFFSFFLFSLTCLTPVYPLPTTDRKKPFATF